MAYLKNGQNLLKQRQKMQISQHTAIIKTNLFLIILINIQLICIVTIILFLSYQEMIIIMCSHCRMAVGMLEHALIMHCQQHYGTQRCNNRKLGMDGPMFSDQSQEEEPADQGDEDENNGTNAEQLHRSEDASGGLG